MSGGYWDYKTDNVCSEIFGWMYPDYGDEGFNQSKIAAKKNPLEDREMSELVWDVFCVLHSFDWYKSCDTGEDSYRADVKRFKDKWLNRNRKLRIKEIVDSTFNDAKEELYKTFGILEEPKDD